MQNQYTPIRIYKNTNKKINQLKTKLSFASKIELVDEMVNFFLDEGINPKNRLDTYKHLNDVKKVVTNRLNRVIGFIQENESRYLEPMMKLLKDAIAEKSIAEIMENERKPEKIQLIENETNTTETPAKISDNSDKHFTVEDQQYKKRFETLKKEFNDVIDLVELKEIKGQRNQKFPVIDMIAQEWHRTVQRVNNI